MNCRRVGLCSKGVIGRWIQGCSIHLELLEVIRQMVCVELTFLSSAKESVKFLLIYIFEFRFFNLIVVLRLMGICWTLLWNACRLVHFFFLAFISLSIPIFLDHWSGYICFPWDVDLRSLLLLLSADLIDPYLYAVGDVVTLKNRILLGAVNAYWDTARSFHGTGINYLFIFVHTCVCIYVLPGILWPWGKKLKNCCVLYILHFFYYVIFLLRT